ncbi:hypothetical protein OPV22_008725 [Ensete ventricosum]|uniref:Uncharacterized protein n=1 Tax=Ensete ventricosum TaxID=4639 RepID=A0AAV8R3L5_ENSVE|nr:hypothetical protein OPV22_008725 [Ensete ventricosum]
MPPLPAQRPNPPSLSLRPLPPSYPRFRSPSPEILRLLPASIASCTISILGAPGVSLGAISTTTSGRSRRSSSTASRLPSISTMDSFPSSQLFKKVDITEERKSDRIDKEPLSLVEVILQYVADWKKVAAYVSTMSEIDYVARFIKLAFAEQFLGPEEAGENGKLHMKEDKVITMPGGENVKEQDFPNGHSWWHNISDATSRSAVVGAKEEDERNPGKDDFPVFFFDLPFLLLPRLRRKQGFHPSPSLSRPLDIYLLRRSVFSAGKGSTLLDETM